MELNRYQSQKVKKIDRFHYGWAILMMGVLVVVGALGLARFGYGIILPSM